MSKTKIYKNVCYGGTAIGSSSAASRLPSAAYDGVVENTSDYSTWFMTSTSGDAVKGAYIGYDFGVGNEKKIEKMIFWGSSSTFENISSAVVEVSDNGTNWTGICDVGMPTTSQNGVTIFIPDSAPTKRFWRLRALSGTCSSGSLWYVSELQMMVPTQNYIVTSINEISIPGDKISCRYTALTSGSVGTFSEFGTCNATEIPVSGTATPDGLFNWIYVGKDYLGRMKFIADRSIQQSISWDTLNTSGVVSELPIKILNTVKSTDIDSLTSSINKSTVYRVVDGITNSIRVNSWQNDNNSMTNDITFKLKVARMVKRYVIYPPTDFAGNIGAWYLQGSNDGTNWATLDYRSSQGGLWNMGVPRVYDITNNTKYLYYRFTPLTGISGSVTAIAEIILMTLEDDPSKNFTVRLPTGGASSADKNNEWDKIIVKSTLNGSIVPGDDNVWHWKGIYSWCSTTLSSAIAYRIVHGNSAVNTYSNSVSSFSSATTGFRPVLLVQNLTSYRYLLQDGDSLLALKHSSYGTTIPTALQSIKKLTAGEKPSDDDFTNYGADDISVLCGRDDIYKNLKNEIKLWKQKRN